MSNERKPLLSDEVILGLTSDDQPQNVAYAVRGFYEDLLTSGELFTKAQVQDMVQAFTQAVAGMFEKEPAPRKPSRWVERLEQLQKEQQEARRKP